MKKLIILAIALVAFPSVSYGDVIIFKSGAAKTGIIEDETPTTVKIRVKDAVVGVSPSNIERIERATPEENRALEQKWKDEKEKLAEERKLREEEAAKLEAEQKAKGLVNVGGRWILPAEAEKLKQQQKLQEMKKQQAAIAAEKAAAAASPETTEIPDYIQNLPPEQRDIAIQDFKRQAKIEVGQVNTQALGRDQTVLRGTVTNKSDTYAGSVGLEVQFYNGSGELLDAQTAEVTDLEPDGSGSLYVTTRLDNSLIKKTKVVVTYVEWR